MNRNTWIIIIVAVIVIIGLIWIFNRGPATNQDHSTFTVGSVDTNTSVPPSSYFEHLYNRYKACVTATNDVPFCNAVFTGVLDR